MKLDTQQVQEGVQAPITQEVQFTQEGVIAMEISNIQTKTESHVQVWIKTKWLHSKCSFHCYSVTLPNIRHSADVHFI